MLRDVCTGLLSCLFVIIAAGCASLTVKDKTVETIGPSRIHEDCLELLPGHVLEYSFEATEAINFNIHYHEDHNVLYVVSKDAVATAQGGFQSEKKHHYCLMWTNPNKKPVTLNYHYGIRTIQ